MKLLLSALVLVCVSVSAYAADSPTYSGKYKINLSLPGHDNAFYCMFTQNNKTLGGYCATEVGNANVTGKVDGRTVSWTYTVKVSGQSITANYSGTLDASGKVSGSMSLPGMPTGIPFTAVPSK
ncbi:MAG TPA: hypothetical protein VGT08_13570 [Terracidiphilus sp.]|nr:hypothetical protein [Terracidiphilus sp.]